MRTILTGTHRANWLLGTLEPEDFAVLQPHLEVVSLPKSAVLYEAEDIISRTYFPQNAMVGLINIMEDGHLVEVASFGREGMFGLLSALVSREAFGRYKVQIPGLASRIPVSRIREAMSARPKLQRLVAGYTEALLAQTFQVASCNAVHTVEARCCNWILSTRDRVDEDLLPLTHADLAELLGVQRSTVSMVLRSLQTTGLISQQRGGIRIVDQAGLEGVACECYRKIRQSYAKVLPVTSA
ncbi:Crp/Fnr family transcriptional regulator [Microvirga makkahensis]|nr:Crp/Fnr family transcriptional regulator [Microvirga makkahensis]